MTYDNDPHAALRATVTADDTTGVQVSTTDVTTEPAAYPLAIAKGQTWDLSVTWLHNGGTVNTVAGTVSLTARTTAGGSAVLSVTGTGGSAVPMTFAQTAAQTAALDFVRARYVLDYASGGTVTRLLTGAVDLTNPGMA